MTEIHSQFHRKRWRLVMAETYSVLLRWSPELTRARAEIDRWTQKLKLMCEKFPELSAPSPYDLAVIVQVLIGLPLVALVDILLLSTVAEYTASIFFPNRSLISQIARFVIPLFVVAIEATLAVITVASQDEPLWTGRNPEYELFNRLGWLMIAMTPLMVLATLVVSGWKGNLGFILLALAQMIFGGILHTMVVKNGRNIRLTTAWLLFSLDRFWSRRKLRAAEKTYDRAAASIKVAYPVFQLHHNKYAMTEPDGSNPIGALPADVSQAVTELFGPIEITRLLNGNGTAKPGFSDDNAIVISPERNDMTAIEPKPRITPEGEKGEQE